MQKIQNLFNKKKILKVLRFLKKFTLENPDYLKADHSWFISLAKMCPSVFLSLEEAEQDHYAKLQISSEDVYSEAFSAAGSRKQILGTVLHKIFVSSAGWLPSFGSFFLFSVHALGKTQDLVSLLYRIIINVFFVFIIYHLGDKLKQ